MKPNSLTWAVCILVALGLFARVDLAQTSRVLSGVVITERFETVADADVEVKSSAGVVAVRTDVAGTFSVPVPPGPVGVKVSGRNLVPLETSYDAGDAVQGLELTVEYAIPPIVENVTIEADALAPDVLIKKDTIYRNSLFGRDDQLIFTLNAGINAGQHEGGGKSLEIRRFGFNTDHGGVNGGLKILIDNVQQNQGTQGHGQGYLGNLKSLSPELVRDVTIINGPFSAAYGDFSGLGVVQVNLREALPDVFTVRLQAGSHNSRRGFFAVSPSWKNVDSFIAYEPGYTDGPFENPLRYRRDNVSGNFTYNFSDTEAAGVKLNFGRNDFFSSGQIPLDEVNAGRLDRFGAIDPENGGKVRLGTVLGYYRKAWESGAAFKADAFVGRSLFDLFSNFTFFLADPVYGDEIQQHDSRLQQGGNVQFIMPYEISRSASVLTAGGGVHLNQINVGLYPTISRDPRRKFLPENIDNPDVLQTKADAKVNNYSGYVQNTTALLDGRLRVEVGIRYDYFSFDVDGFELGGRSDPGPCNSDFADPVTPENPCVLILDGRESAARFQPKLAVAYTPLETIPLTFHANYGRGIATQDARGVIRNPDAPKIATTDFYQLGAAYNTRRVSAVFSSFLIDRSNEQVYIPDDGSIEFAGRSRSYGIEARTSVRFNRFVSLNAGLTQVLRAYFPGEFTAEPPRRRIIVDSAPHTVANGGLVLENFRGFTANLTWRHISSYRLDGEDPAIKAAGHDVVDLWVSKRLRRWLDLSVSLDNLLNKKYFETQNFFESRISPGADPVSRIHATPGYPFTVSVGVAFRFGAKN